MLSYPCKRLPFSTGRHKDASRLFFSLFDIIDDTFEGGIVAQTSRCVSIAPSNAFQVAMEPGKPLHRVPRGF